MPKTIFFINSADYKLQFDAYNDDLYGIYVLELDTDTGTMEIIGRDDTVPSVQFFHIDAENKRLYAGHRVTQGEGELLVFDTDSATGELSYLNRQETGNSSLTFVSMSRDKRFLLTFNYSSPGCVGQVNVFPVADNGEVLPIQQSIQHNGKSINEKRQDCSHPHMIDIHPTGQLVLVPDLGIDKLMLYDFDNETGQLAPHDPPFKIVPAGSGPRHFTFHPNGKYLYLLNELSATIQPYRYDASVGTLTEMTLVPTLPDDFTERNTAADIHITPDGTYLYSTNRGHDSLAMFRIEANGELSFIGRKPTWGNHPRHFNIDPSGQFLLVGNQHSHTVMCFHIDPATGKLDFTGQQVSIPSPNCIYPYI